MPLISLLCPRILKQILFKGCKEQLIDFLMIILLISLIILMATKLEKLQRLRIPKQQTKNQSSKLPPFNQTIIINNPNININYLNDNSRANDPLSSRGLDNWNLNNNLKQFSETRQVGFYKKKRHNERNQSNSPYVIHKVCTQDIRSINKIYGTRNLKQTLTTFRKNETLNHITIDQDKVEPNPPSVLEKILKKQEKVITQKLYHHSKRNPKIELQKNFETLPTTFLNTHQNNPQIHPRTFRNNRFQAVGSNIASLTDRPHLPSSQQEEREEMDLLQKKEECDQDQQVRYEPKNIAPRLIPFQMRKRAFNKTIESINKGLLSQTDSYLDRTFVDKVPQSQIELFVNSLNQPEHGRSVHERSSHKNNSEWIEYDFHFDEQRKKRPKTPKRKKPYQQTQ